MKKLIKKYWKIMVVIVILGIFVLLFFLVRYKGKKNLEANIAAEQQDVFEEMASFRNTIDYHLAEDATQGTFMKAMKKLKDYFELYIK